MRTIVLENNTLQNSKVYKDWVKGVNIISIVKDKFDTFRIITEDEGTYRLLRFFKFNEWVVSCDIEAREINDFLNKVLIELNAKIN